MTTEETTEWNYVFNERLGLLCEDRDPTPEQHKMAVRDADAAVERMKACSPKTG